MNPYENTTCETEIDLGPSLGVTINQLRNASRQVKNTVQVNILMKNPILVILISLIACTQLWAKTERRYGKIEVNKEFTIENISEANVKITIINKEGNHYIRSWYKHGWNNKQKDYLIQGPVKSISLDHNKIQVTHDWTKKSDIAATIYMINNHGEAIKVDVITHIDLTW